MATVEEVLAKAAAWEKAGKPENAAKLRAYAETLKPAAPKYDAATVEAKAVEWEKAGDPAKAAKLRSFAATLPKAPAPVDTTGPATPRKADPVAGSPEAKQAQVDELALFEMANPKLRGKFTPETLPKPGETIPGANARERVTVQPWQNVKADTFGETAKTMVEGPIAAAKAFAGGLSGGPSPSRGYLEGEGVPAALAAPLGVVGDLGGAALSTVGAGISGAIGLGAELVPGQSSADEKKFAEDVTGMAMFAVPELAGASSVPARMAAAAPKVAPQAAAVPKVAGDVAAAERLGIPVMRSDVKPPQSFIGKVAQKTGESIPLAGTGPLRAKQNAARVEAVKDFIGEYIGETILPAINDVTSALLEKRSGDLSRLTGQKTSVVEKLKARGPVPVPGAIAEIDRQIAALSAQRLGELKPVIDKLNDFKGSLIDQPLDVIEKNRKAVGKAFADPGLANIRDAGEKALSAIYSPLRDDIAAFVKARGGPGDAAKWKAANADLAALAGDLKDTALKRVLTKGDETPEAVRLMLFSQKPSDVMRLYRSLPEKGKQSARTAIVQEAVAKAGGLDALTPDKFKQALSKLSNQIGVFFRGEDFEAADGLLRALRLTERGARAADAPPTGVQTLPAILGLGLGSTIGAAPAIATGLGIGTIARVYEATGVRATLRRIAKTENPKVQSVLLKKLDEAIRDAGVPLAAQSGTEQPARRALP